ncbi:YDG domain-containing protein [Rubritalea sp.]|uniref:YDG domain-containing protein n=1 Tax=Rubritalea sp. TaxID=2109375 RepID=UPI003EF50474
MKTSYQVTSSLTLLAYIQLVVLSPSLLLANPSGGVVSSGDATIHSSGNTLTIDQLTDQAIINWQDFSIGSGELTQFNQLNRNSAVLNRVVGNNLSAIHGRLQANGQVFLINQNGIVVGDQGVIQTAGFVGSTHRLSDSDFLAGGDLNFTAGDQGGAIINLGEISVSGGDVFLIADQVANHGSITATDGTVGLAAAAGAEVTLADSGEQRLLVQPSTSVTGKDGVVNQGSINAVNAELKAAGGNVYALGINNNGAIRATGVQNVGGRILLTSKGGKIKLGSNSNINASGAEGGGQVNIGGSKLGEGPIDNAAEVIVEAGSEIAANATVNGDGGEVIVFAEKVADLAGSISATGGVLGGDGGFIETSGKENWSYAGWASGVNVSATLGMAGEFLIDPNDITISSAGTGSSGNNALNNTDIVNFLNGGSSLTIATDSSAVGGDGDITVNNAILYDSTADFTLLAGRDLNFNASVQNSNDTGGDLNLVAGWDGTTGYNTANFNNADLSSTTIFGNNSGSINIGDGTQISGIAVGSRSGETNVFGYDLRLRGGDTSDEAFAQLGLQISDQGAGYTITGSIAARMINEVTAESGDAEFSYTQIGHVGADRIFDFRIDATTDANITIAAGGDLSFLGGGDLYSYSQLGHGGRSADGSKSGDITITEAGDLIFTGGSANITYSHLGHGGISTDGRITGDITINQVANLIFTAGSANSTYSQLGHGGEFTDGNHSGAITITEANDLIFTGGGGIDAYSQLGHGGTSADGDHSGAITITEANDLTFTGGEGLYSYSQLGHGGYDADGDHSGAITIAEANDLTFTGGGDNFTYSQLGHGGDSAFGDHSGVITITEVNDLVFTGGVGFAAYSQLGHGGRSVFGNYSGAITITEANDLTFTGGGGGFAYSRLSHGGVQAVGSYSGEITITEANDLTFTGGGGEFAYSQLGHGGAGLGNYSGAIMITDANNLSFTGGSGGNAYSLLGHGAANFGSADQAIGFRSGDITVTASGEISLQDGANANANYAWIGHGSANNAATDADITLTAASYDRDSGSSIAVGEDGSIRRGIIENGLLGGDVTIAATGSSLEVIDGSGNLDNLSGGEVNDGNFSVTNNLTLLASHDLNLNVSIQNFLDVDGGGIHLIAGWDGVTTYDFTTFDGADLSSGTLFGNNLGSVHIGDGTQTNGIAVGSRSGETNVFGYDFNLSGSNTTDEGFAQLGFQVSDQGADYNITGGITVGVLNDITAASGSEIFSYTQVGHVGADRGFDLNIEATTDAMITIAAGGDLTFRGGGKFFTYSQLGHGGYSAFGDYSGAITITEANDLTFTGSGGNSAYSQLGHGGVFADGNHSGAITITEVTDLTFTGGGNESAYSQLGHGGGGAEGNHSGAITITEANDLTFTGGNVRFTYSQLGHGGMLVEGNHSGAITITEANDLTFTGGGGNNAYSLLGHGSADFGGIDQLPASAAQATGTRSGDITVTASGEISLQDGVTPDSSFSYAWIGHGSADNTPTDANITLTAVSYDRDSSSSILAGGDGSIRRGIIENGLLGGDVTIATTGSSLEVIDGSVDLANLSGGEVNDGSYDSANDLLIIASNDLILAAGATLNNAGAGNIIFSAGENFHNDTGSLTPVTTTSGRSLIYSSRPDVNRNDIEITNMDFLSFGQTFSLANPIASGLPSGYGLIYTEIPMVTTTAVDQVITYGETAPTSTVIQSASYGGNVIDTAEWGLSISGSTTNVAGISGVLDAGSYNDAYTANATVVGLGGEAVEGVTELFISGDLTVNQRGLTISSNADDKVYDTTTGADVTFGDDRVVGDALTVTSISDEFSDENVGINKVVTSTGLALSGADAANYFITNATNEVESTADITAATLTINGVSAENKVYDTNTVATLTGGMLGGILGANSVDLVSGTGEFSDRNVGVGKVVTASGFGLSGVDAGNYVITGQPSGLTADITAATLTINGVSAENKVYDTNTVATLTGGMLGGILGADSVDLVSGTGEFGDRNVGVGKVVTATGYALSGADSGNYVISGQPSGLTADITVATLNVSGITVLDKFYDGTTSAILVGGQLDGILGGDDVDLVVGSGLFLDPEIGYFKPIATTGYGIAGGDAGNYQISGQPAGVTGNILPRTNNLLSNDHDYYRYWINQFNDDAQYVGEGTEYFGWLPEYSEEVWELIKKEQADGSGLDQDETKRLEELLSEAFSTVSN